MTKKAESPSDLVSVCMDCKHPLTKDNEPIPEITIDLAQGDPGVPISHGLCNICVIERRKELDRYKAERARSKKA